MSRLILSRLTMGGAQRIAIGAILLGMLALLLSGVLATDWSFKRAHAHPASDAGQTGIPAAAADTHTVTFTCCEYTQAHLIISAGDSVAWQGDFSFHPLVSEEGLWAMVGQGNSFSHTFGSPGRYRYYCDFHGAAGGVGMSGTVTVVVNAYLPLVAD